MPESDALRAHERGWKGNQRSKGTIAITVKEFRESPELVAEMRKLLEHPALKLWLEAMDETNPAKKAAPVGIQSHDAFIMLGEQTGWMDYRDRFRLGGIPLEQPPKQEEQTYAEPPLEPE